MTARGAQAGTIDVLKDGLVGRGVLLDVPRVRGVPWVEPGEHVFREDLEAAERTQGVVEVGPATSCSSAPATRRLAELGPWDTRQAKAGLHPTAASFLADRRIAALGSDGNNDTAPSTTEGVAFPIHVLALNAMGVHLLDYLQFEDVARHCEAVGAGSSCSPPLRCGSSAEPGPRSIRRRSSGCSISGSTVLPSR